MSFLKAEWRKIAMANYSVDPEILLDYIPYGTELDLWEGKCFISLVGFMFKDTKLMGVRFPFHINFEEVNLRFYVKRFENGTWKRGVVFIKEIVPKPAISFVANLMYKESYATLPMRHQWEESENERRVTYQWKKNKKWQTFHVTAVLEASEIPANSEAEFIAEHYWGYAKVNDTRTNEYEVTHPRWRHFPVKNYELNVDFGAVYGENFACLDQLKPHSVMLAEGSEITVEKKRMIY